METVKTGRFETSIGTFRVALGERGLLFLELPHANGGGLPSWLARMVPDARIERRCEPPAEVVRQIEDFLSGERESFDLPLDLRGTPFQLAVWRELLRIPYGEVRSYGEVARAIGRPRAVRAVGAANGANPLPLLVPCHRVVASGGRLGGYGGGLELKRRLLALEASRARTPAKLV